MDKKKSSMVPLKMKETIKFNLSDFPEPFITKNNELDIAFILGDDVSPGTRVYKPASISDGAAVGFATYAIYNNKSFSQIKRPPKYVVTTWVNSYNIAKKYNLIVIGSPKVNRIAREINEGSEIQFMLPYCKNISMLSNKKLYSDEEYPSLGVIYLSKNPFNKDKYALVIAGCHGSGTWAAGHALATKMLQIKEKKISKAVITIGADHDRDGVIDDSQIIDSV